MKAHGELDLVVGTGQDNAIVRSLCSVGGYNVPLAANPFNSWAKVLDCGDIPVSVLFGVGTSLRLVANDSENEVANLCD
jgi:hypothetical protein